MNCEVEKLFLGYVTKAPHLIQRVLKKKKKEKWFHTDLPFLWLPSLVMLDSDPYIQIIISHIFVSDGLFVFLKSMVLSTKAEPMSFIN